MELNIQTLSDITLRFIKVLIPLAIALIWVSFLLFRNKSIK